MPEPTKPSPTNTGTEPHSHAPADQTVARDDEPSLPQVLGGDTEPRFAPAQHAGELGTFGRYRVLQKLGQGGMGAVYLGYDAALERKIALKVMLPQYAANGDARERFLREARAAAKIKSDHVVTIFDVGEQGGIPFIAMEYLLGYPLDKFLKEKGELPLGHVLRVCRETAIGLAAAHKLGLIHRDIKPGNLWLESPKGRVKLLDFGLARKQDDDAHLTGSGAVMGTPAYMSPEQARGLKVDHRTDLFSLGVMMYRLCTGRMPFSGSTSMAVLTSLAVDTPTPVRQLRPELPEAVEAVVTKLLAKDPAARFQSAMEVVAAIREIENPRASGPMPVVATPVQPMAVGAQTQNVWESIDESESVPVPLATPADTEAASEPSPAPEAKPGRRRQERASPKWPAILAVALLVGACAALAAILLRPAHGTLTIMDADPDVELVIKKDGQAVQDRTKDREFTLEVGSYTIEFADPKEGWKIEPDTVKVAKGGSHRVRVVPTQGKLIILEAEADLELVIKRDGQVVRDRTNAREFSLDPGSYTVELVAPGEGTSLERDKFDIAKSGQVIRIKVLMKNRPKPPAGKVYPLPPDVITQTPVKPKEVFTLDHLDPANPKHVPPEEKFPWQPKDDLVAILGSHRQRSPVADQLAISPDGAVVIPTQLTPHAVIEIKSGKLLNWPAVGAFSPDGKRVAGANKVWDVTEMTKPVEMRKPPVEYALPGNIQAFLTNDIVLIIDGAGIYAAWKLDPKEPKPLAQFPKMRSHAVSNNRKFFATTNRTDFTCDIFDITAKGLENKRTLPGAEGKMTASPNSRFEISLSNTGLLATIDKENVVRVWDVTGEKPQVRHTLDEKALGELVCIFPEGDRVIRADQNGFDVWTVGAGKPEKIAALTSPRVGINIGAVAVTPDAQTIVTGHFNGVVHFWGIKKLENGYAIFERNPLRAQGLLAMFADLSPDGRFGALFHEDIRTHIWDFEKLESRQLDWTRESTFRFAPDGATGCVFKYWDPPAGLRIVSLSNPAAQPVDFGTDFRPCCYSPDGKWLAASDGKELAIWDVVGSPKELFARVPCHQTTGLWRFTPDGRFLIGVLAAPGTSYEKIKVWAMTPRGPILRFETTIPCDHFTLSPDGKTAVFCHRNNGMAFYDLKEGVLFFRSDDKTGTPWADYSPDGRMLLVGGNQLRLLDAATGTAIREWTLRAWPYGGRFHPDGRHVFVTNADGTTYILRLNLDPDRKAAEYVLSISGTVKVRVDGQEREIKDAAELPQGRFALISVMLPNRNRLTDGGLENFRGCKDITYLDLSNTKVTDAGLANFKECKNLTNLHLGNTKVSTGLTHFEGCKSLRVLALSGTMVGDEQLTRFLECKGLVSLNVQKTKVTPGKIEEFSKALPKCKIIHDGGIIEPNAGADPDRAAAEWVIAQGGFVRINSVGKDIKAAAELPGGRFALTFVSLNDRPVTDAGLELFRGLGGLTELDLRKTQVSDAGLAHLREIKSLTRLYLDGAQVTDAGLAHLKDLKGLKTLYLSSTQVTDTGLAELKELKSLAALYLKKTKVTAKGAGEFHAAVPGCKVEYEGGTIEPKAGADPDRKAAEWALSVGGAVEVNGKLARVEAAADLPPGPLALTGVHLTGKKGATDEALAVFKDCKNLTELYLPNTPVTDAGLAHFKQCKDLTALRLDGTSATDAGLAHFKDCKSLQLLLLDKLRVGDAGLAHFKGCEGLLEIRLRGTDVTDAGLAHFKDCKQLRTLDVRNTKVTKEAIAEFAKAHPLCKIEWDGGTIEPKK